MVSESDKSHEFHNLQLPKLSQRKLAEPHSINSTEKASSKRGPSVTKFGLQIESPLQVDQAKNYVNLTLGLGHLRKKPNFLDSGQQKSTEVGPHDLIVLFFWNKNISLGQSECLGQEKC